MGKPGGGCRTQTATNGVQDSQSALGGGGVESQGGPGRGMVEAHPGGGVEGLPKVSHKSVLGTPSADS